jgi:hypothetical protein
MGKSRDHSDLQDMYRRALAASWAAQTGELPADQCIEDIFSGGDGWREKYDPEASLLNTRTNAREDSPSGDEHENQTRRHRSTGSTSSSRSQNTVKDAKRPGHKKHRSREMDMGRATGIQSPHSAKANQESSEQERERGRGRNGFRYAREVDEFDIREDLIAWKLPGRVSS